MSRWWRAEDSSIDHPKLLRLSDSMFRAWYTLNCIASANDGVLPPTSDIAIRLRIKPAKVAEWITKLVAAGLYDNEDGVFTPHNWDVRQYKTKETPPETLKGRYIYFIGSAASPSILKIGISKNPWARVVDFQTSHPEKLSVVASFKTKEVSEVEIHGLLVNFRKQGEWFDLPDFVRDIVGAAHSSKSDYAALITLLRSCLRETATVDRSNYVAAPRAEAEAEQNRIKAEQSRAEQTPARRLMKI